MDELIEDALDNPLLKGITFSGGDPLERAEEFAYMAKAFKKAGLNIWCYTPFQFFLPTQNGRIARSQAELSMGIFPSSRNVLRYFSWWML